MWSHRKSTCYIVIRKKPTRTYTPKLRITANHMIRFPEVRVLDSQGEMLGIMSSREAQDKARDAEKDLVLITDKSQPPVVKIIELTKHRYQLQQKESQQRKSSRKQDIKEVRFTPFMGAGDFESRLKKVIDFIERGDKVRLSLQFKGREITKKEFGYEQFNKIFEKTADIAKVEIEPKMMGKKLIAQLMPSK